MPTDELGERPHRRRNPLTGQWVLVSPHRTQRPWQGQTEELTEPVTAPYEPDCYLCPGNERAGGAKNPAYAGTYVFDNDYPALLPGQVAEQVAEVNPLVVSESVRGVCRVVCYSPRHDLSLAELEEREVEAVIDTWVDETVRLTDLGWVRHVQIFENRGSMMGASNPHPHGQIWAENRLPSEPAVEAEHQLDHWRRHGRCLLCDYRALEGQEGSRLVYENDHVSVVVPFWAVWPFELMVIARRHVADLPSLHRVERAGLASALQAVVGACDRLFGVPFPYSMGFHQGPTDRHEESHHLHAHLYPPLLRSATVRKFMVGYEMLGQPQRDLTAESAAARLAALVRDAR